MDRHWGDRLGSLETDKLADLIVVDGDPLRDLGALERVVAVVAGGRLVDQPAAPPEDQDP